ncbi:MAG: hypothetical protein EAZ76_11375 [Nostocales cyanobacterium]|nr:MAG: hypothetical protein EAZ87_05140 [Nostocales cyanobacterium]TAF13556.1 MAG: hypothetical protein EAZ76_11375 [Nostocales cyanobacterium]
MLIPTIADSRISIERLNILRDMKSDSLVHENLKEENQEDHNVYIPPNYGAPDSSYGSGTR